MIMMMMMLMMMSDDDDEMRMRINVQAVILSGVVWFKSDHQRHLVAGQSGPVSEQVANCRLSSAQLIDKPEVATHDVSDTSVPTQRKSVNR